MEQLMQYMWHHRLLPATGLTTVDGLPVAIIDPGTLNSDAGPDFFNAKVRIGRKVWAGDVEIHVRASDWHRHGHDGDAAYSSVILHVVSRDDTMIRRDNGEVIPQMIMECNADFSADYHRLVSASAAELPCGEHILSLPKIHVGAWIDALAYERIYSKTERITDLLSTLAGDWEEVCYITVARALGTGLNSEPFERLARQMPLKLLRKHADSLTDVEAMLFGRAGMLDAAPASDPYVAELTGRYRFMARKFGLTPIAQLGWKMSRTRPQNQPHRRVAFLAAMIHAGFRLLNAIISVGSADEARELFAVELGDYWRSRYGFGSGSVAAPQRLGDTAVRSLIINAVVPLMAAYGLTHGDEELFNRAVAILQSMPPEVNRLTRTFAATGIECRDAFVSQALIQLRRGYCEQHKCLYCRFGHRLLASRAVAKQ